MTVIPIQAEVRITLSAQHQLQVHNVPKNEAGRKIFLQMMAEGIKAVASLPTVTEDALLVPKKDIVDQNGNPIE